MKAYAIALGLPLLLGIVRAATAASAVIDFSAISTVTSVAMVPNPDGKLNQVTRAGIPAVQTTGATGGTPGYLYLAVKSGLFDGSKALWMSVDYFDEGKDTFEVEYNGVDTDPGGNKTANPFKVANPFQKQKFDSKGWKTQIFALPGFMLQGAMAGHADIRIDDKGDGPEIIGRITLTDEAPETIHFPHVDPTHPIVIDGAIGAGEWDGARTFILDRAELDANNGVFWGGPQDFSGTYSFKWDEKGLYVLGQVTDAMPRLNDRPGPDNYWDGDGMELFIGLDASNPGRSSFLPNTDFQVLIGLGDKALGGPGPSWGILHGTSGLPSEDRGPIPAQNLAIVNMQTPKGYIFELFLPWTFLRPDASVTPGQEIAWDMLGDNSTVIGPSRQQVAMSPFGRKFMFLDPSGWTAVTLDAIRVENPPLAGP